MRGEDANAFMMAAFPSGSPPHARGRRRERKASGRVKRDHPRMRGEDDEWTVVMTAQSGSPPHARGRLVITPSISGGRRITPACAGKTFW